MDKRSNSESDDREKSQEVDATEGRSYPLIFVLGLALGIGLGGALLGGAVGTVVGLVLGGGIGGALQSLVSSRRNGGS